MPAPIEMAPDEFRAAGHALIDRIADFLQDVRSARPSTGESPNDVRDLLPSDQGLPRCSQDADLLLRRASELLFNHSTLNGSPKFWGYITSCPAPIGFLGDLLASAANPNVGAWALSPMATEIEAQTIRWISEMLGYPLDCGGLFVSGGNMANIVCFLAARKAQAGADIRQLGMGGTRMRVYCSSETHTWVQKAADIAGLGTDAIRWIETDSQLRMNLRALREEIKKDMNAGDRPAIVIGAAGSVSTGAVDPLAEMSDICREFGLWLHVDGAYGGFAAILPDKPEELKGLERADSIAVDPHKWLYAPLEAGCALVKSPSALRDAFAYHPPYYHFGEEAINYFDLGPQNSRGFRALKVWLALQQAGLDGYVEMISENCRLSRVMFQEIESFPPLEAFTQSLSIVTFRYRPQTDMSDDYLNELNRELLTRLQNGGDAYLSNAVIDGKFLLRACIVNFRTNEADVRALPSIVVKLGEKIDAEMRPGARVPRHSDHDRAAALKRD